MSLTALANKTMKTPAKKESKKITLPVDATIEPAIAEYIEAVEALKAAEAKKDALGTAILAHAEPLYHKQVVAAGFIEPTAHMGDIRITWKGESQFATASSIGDGERAKAAFGADYDRYFGETQGALELTPEAVNNPQIADQLVALVAKLQEETGVQILRQTVKVVTKDALHAEWATNPEPIEAKLREAGITKTKPTIVKK